MRALVTGAGGFVGPHLLAHLAELGDDASGVDLSNGPDLLDPEGWMDLVAAQRPEVIYHLAGWSDVGGSWSSPRTAWRVNTEGVMSVLEAAVAAGVRRVVVVSSADIYGIVRPDQLPLTEKTPIQPRSPYGASKEGAEAIARHYQRGRSFDVVIARPFNHIGPGQSPQFVASAFASRIAELERQAASPSASAAPNDDECSIGHGDLSPRRDFTDVRDVVRAYRLLATEARSGETYNICSGTDVAVSELLDQLISLAEVPVTTVADQSLYRPVDLPVLRGSHAKLTADTGWTPEIPLDRTLADVLADARNRATTGAPT